MALSEETLFMVYQRLMDKIKETLSSNKYPLKCAGPFEGAVIIRFSRFRVIITFF